MTSPSTSSRTCAP